MHLACWIKDGYKHLIKLSKNYCFSKEKLFRESASILRYKQIVCCVFVVTAVCFNFPSRFVGWFYHWDLLNLLFVSTVPKCPFANNNSLFHVTNKSTMRLTTLRLSTDKLTARGVVNSAVFIKLTCHAASLKLRNAKQGSPSNAAWTCVCQGHVF